MLSLHATDFQLTKITGDDIYDWIPALEGSGTSYDLLLPIPKDRHGIVVLDLNSNVLKRSNTTDDTITASAPVVIAYDTREPFPTLRDMPARIEPGIWDIYIRFNVLITHLDFDAFEAEGVNLGTPKLYYSLTDTNASKALANAVTPTAVNFDSTALAITENLAATQALSLADDFADTPGLEKVNLDFGGNALKITEGEGLGDLTINIQARQSTGAAFVLYYKDGAKPNSVTDGTVIPWTSHNWNLHGTHTPPPYIFTANWNSGEAHDADIGRFYWIKLGAATNITQGTLRIRYAYNRYLKPTQTSDLADTVGSWHALTDANRNTQQAKYFLLRYVNPDPLPSYLLGNYGLRLKRNTVRGPTGAGTAVPLTLPPTNERSATFTANTAFSEKWTIYGENITAHTVTGLPNGVTATWSPASPTGASIHELTIAGTTSAAFTATVTITEGSTTTTFTIGFTLSAGALGQGGQIQSTPVIGTPTVDPTTMLIDTAFTTYIPISGNPAFVKVKGLLHEQFAYTWESANNRVKIFGTPTQYQNGTWRVEAYDTALTDTPVLKEFVWAVGGSDIAITPIANLKLYRGVPINFTVPISNDPTAANVQGLQIGLKFEKVTAGAKVVGQLPAAADGNFTVTTEDFIVRASGNTSQTYMENSETLQGVKATQSYEILAGSPGTLSFTATAGFKSVTLTITKPTHAIETEYQIDGGEWKSAGTGTSYTIPNLPAGTAVSIKMRVVSPWVSAATAAQTVTPTNYIQLHAQNQNAQGVTLQGDSILIGQTATALNTSRIFFYNKSTYAYEKQVDTSLFAERDMRIETIEQYNEFYLLYNTNTTIYIRKYDQNIANGVSYTVVNNSSARVRGILRNLQNNSSLYFLVDDGSRMDSYFYVRSNNAVSLSNNNFESRDLSGYCGSTYFDFFYYNSGSLPVLRKYHFNGTYQSGQDITLSDIPSNTATTDCKGLVYDATAKTLYFLTSTRLYIIENLTL